MAEAKHRIIVECTIAGAAIIAGIGLFVIPVVGQFAAASAAATAAALIAFTGAAVGTLAATACTIAATVLVGAALGAVSAVAINLVVAQPIRMAFGDQQWLDWNAGEAVQWAKGGAIGGAFSGGVIGAAQLGGALSPALAASTPRLAAALNKLPAAVTSTPGRMTVGSLGNAATGQMLNGRVTGLDVLLGAVGGLGGTTARPSAGRVDALRSRLIMDERGSVSFGRSGEPPDTPLVNMRAPVDEQGRLPVPLGWEAQVGIQQHRGVPHGGDMAVSALTNGGRNLEVVLVDFKGHGAEVAPDALPWAEKMQRTLLESPGDDFMPAANALAMDFWEGGPPAWHANVDLHTGAFDLRIAGGDPALIYHADTGEVTLAAPEIAPMLGAIPGMDWPPLQGQLQPGDALILYTDGMIEHRRIDKDIGIELLGQEAAHVLAKDYWDNTGRILDWLPDYGDDRALVVIRRPPAP